MKTLDRNRMIKKLLDSEPFDNVVGKLRALQEAAQAVKEAKERFDELNAALFLSKRALLPTVEVLEDEFDILGAQDSASEVMQTALRKAVRDTVELMGEDDDTETSRQRTPKARGRDAAACPHRRWSGARRPRPTGVFLGS